VDGSQILRTDVPTTAQPVGTHVNSAGGWLIDIGDVYLQAGHTYTFRVHGVFQAVWLLRSDESNVSTWAQNHDDAVASLVMPDVYPQKFQPRDGTLTFTATTTCWCALVFRGQGLGNGVDPVVARVKIVTS
jgi:hypothetical protein